MKVLFLVQAERRVILDRLYESISKACNSCDIRWLSSDEQANLRRYFKKHVDSSQYDRVLCFLRFKKEIYQWRFLRTVPNLVVLEHDAYQNYMPGKYAGKFSAHYRRMPWVRVINSGAQTVEKLNREDVDARFVPKGYDHKLLKNINMARDIELAFVGSVKSKTYSGRKALLDELGQLENLVITRTASGGEYWKALNRIRFFVSADVGFGEYMIKNFEALACGCVLFAYDQGETENRRLGFVDMENLVLYRNIEELRSKLARLRADSELADRIARSGQLLAQSSYSFAHLGGQIVDAMRDDLRPFPQPNWLARIRNRLGL